MPTYMITAPDGKKFRVTGPGTKEQALAQIQARYGVSQQRERFPMLSRDPQQFRQGVEDVKRQTGLTGRAIAGGLAEGVRPFTEPVRTMLNAALRAAGRETEIPPIEQGAEAAATAAGLPQPQGELEENIQSAGRFVTAAGVGTGATGAMARGAGIPARQIARDPRMQTLQSAQREGYVVPPATANPTALNRLTEGVAGKLSTAQQASARNQEVTNRLAKRALGVPDDSPISRDVLDGIRARAGEVYDRIAKSGDIIPDGQFQVQVQALTRQSDEIAAAFPKANVGARKEIADLAESLKSEKFNAKAALEYLKQLRKDASANLSFQASADPTKRALGRAQREAADILEDMIMRHLNKRGDGAIAHLFDQARREIAKSYTVEAALNESTGNVSAVKLAQQLAKGKPLSGELELAARFGQAFPKAAREFNESLPGISPLDWYAGAGVTGLTGNPASMALPLIRPTVRSLALGPAGQRMAQPGFGQLPPELMIGAGYGAATR